jgi:hypothetical protein
MEEIDPKQTPDRKLENPSNQLEKNQSQLEKSQREKRVPNQNQKMDIPVPKRSGIIIGPEGPYPDNT